MGTHAKSRLSKAVIMIILLVIVILTFFPYYFMVISSFKNNAEISAHPFTVTLPFRFENYISSFWMILGYFKNSLIVTGVSVIFTSLIAISSSYVFAKFEFPGKSFLYMFILAFLMIPGVLTLIPQYVLVSDMKMIGTYWAAILPFVATAQIQFIVVLRPYIEGLPQDLFEAAKLDGAGGIKTFFYVVSPLIKPTLTSQMLLTFLNSWNDFVWPMLTLSSNRKLKTITLGLYSYRDVQQILYGPMFAGFVLAAIPLVILFSVNMKNFIGGLTAGAVKS